MDIDEIELVRRWGDKTPDPAPAARDAARSALVAAMAAEAAMPAVVDAQRDGGRPGPRDLLHRTWATERFRKAAALGAISTAAIMVQPHLALGLPGHRALGWLVLLLLVRLVGGTGWATTVGLAAALGTLAIGRSPNGSFWGVLQYVLAGFGVDAALHVRPRIADSPARLAVLGALILVAVGWVTPISNSFVSGTGIQQIWVSMIHMRAGAWFRLIGFDVAFGAGAGGLAYGMAWALRHDWLRISHHFHSKA